MVVSRVDYISAIVFTVLWAALLIFNVTVFFISVTGGGSLWWINALLVVFSVWNMIRFINTIRDYREQVSSDG